METIFSQHFLLVFRLVDVCKVDSLRLAGRHEKLLAARNIFFLQLTAEPLVDLILRLGTLYDVQPVTAWSLGILRSDNLDPVTVLDDIIDRNQLSVGFCTDHFVADRGVNAVRKINRRRPVRQVLDIAGRCKAEYRVRKKIQITL